MNPAIDYLIRTNLIKNWFELPCSIFLYEKTTNNKIVLTINEEFTKSNFFSIKKWNIGCCKKEHVLPDMTECRVLKEQIFQHPATILPDHRLINYIQQSVMSNYNSHRTPMSVELYAHFNENSITSFTHKKYRENWLWQHFTKIYLPDLSINLNYINIINNEQKELVSKYRKKEWKYWQIWKKHLLLHPGELIFYKEYEK